MSILRILRISPMFGQKAGDGLPARQIGPEAVKARKQPENVLHGTYLENMDPNSACCTGLCPVCGENDKARIKSACPDGHAF